MANPYRELRSWCSEIGSHFHHFPAVFLIYILFTCLYLILSLFTLTLLRSLGYSVCLLPCNLEHLHAHTHTLTHTVVKADLSEKYIDFHMLSSFVQHLTFLTKHITVLWSFSNIFQVLNNIDVLCNYYTAYTQFLQNMSIHYAIYEKILHIRWFHLNTKHGCMLFNFCIYVVQFFKMFSVSTTYSIVLPHAWQTNKIFLSHN